MTAGAEEQGTVIPGQKRGFFIIDGIDFRAEVHCRSPVAGTVTHRNKDIESAEALLAVAGKVNLLAITADGGM